MARLGLPCEVGAQSPHARCVYRRPLQVRGRQHLADLRTRRFAQLVVLHLDQWGERKATIYRLFVSRPALHDKPAKVNDRSMSARVVDAMGHGPKGWSPLIVNWA